ncbi:MAG TPA: carboxypeptidase regulatory-like domain-containing protein [Terriglobales bacterium]|nr:carboxypeptidase regulatory-like domain-containing protein [Terriglobales bacterium]
MARHTRSILASTALLWSLLFVASSTERAFAQGSVTGRVNGTIVDSSQAVVPGATVMLRNVQTNEQRTATTGGSGTYEFLNVPIGQYEITVTHTGFAAAKSRLEVTVQSTSVVNFTMQVSSAAETVTVTASAEVLNTVDASLGGVVSNEKVTELPLNGRSFVDLVSLQAGATPIISTAGGRTSATRNDGGFINGTDDFYNDFTIDGGDFNDISVPGSLINKALIGTGIPPDAIAEFKVLTGGADAEFGTVAGAHVNVVTKSGTNQYHGTGWEFFRSDALNARNYFDPPNTAKLPFTLNQFGGVLGGPVVRDKNFFFGSYEAYRQTLKVTAVPVVPTPLLLASVKGGPANGNFKELLQAFYPAPDPGFSPTALVAPLHVVQNQGNDRNAFIVRDDAQISSKDRFFARVVYNHATGTPGVILSTGLQGGNNGFGWNTFVPEIAWTRLISNTMVNEARFNYNRSALSVSWDEPPDAVAALGFSKSAADANGLPSITFSGTGLTNAGVGTNIPQGRHDNVFQWTDTLSMTRGRYNIKTGFNAFRYQINSFGADTPRRNITFVGFGPPFDTAVNGVTTAKFQTQTQTFNLVPLNSSKRYPRYSLFAGFVNGAMQARRNLTINLGLRYEINTIPREKNGTQNNIYQLDSNGNPIPDAPITNIANVGLFLPKGFGYAPIHKNEFQPRVGFSWSPMGWMVVRGGYGIYYQRPDLFGFNTGTGNPPFSFPTSITNQVFGTVADPAQFATTKKNISGYDPGNQAIYVQNYTFNLQFKTDRNGFLQVGYAGSHTLHYNIGTAANFGAAFTGVRPNSVFNTISITENLGNSHYNGLQVEYNHRYSHGFSAQVSYTYSKNIGLVEAGAVPTDHFNYNLDKGRMEADFRQMIVANSVYSLPFGHGKPWLTSGIASHILGNWALSGVFSAHSGQPFSITAGADVNGDGNATDRAQVLPGHSIREVYASGATDKTQFLKVQSAVNNVILARTGGVLTGRDAFEGPALFNVDFAVQKNVPMGEQRRFEFRSEFFNLFNHTNFSNPNSTLSSPLFGKILGTATNSRQIQLGFKFYF